MSAPRALKAPAEAVVVLSDELLERTLDASRQSDRRRMILPFHKSAEESPHRMFNAMQPGTYVRPHRHLDPPKSEVFLLLRGALDFIVFDEHGAITFARRLEAGTPEFGIDIAPRLFHGIVVRAPDTLIYEVKPGPYTAASDKDFAPWAPVENSDGVAAYVRDLDAALERFRA